MVYLGMRNVETEPGTDEKNVAFWRINSGRIVAALFVDSNDLYRYQTDCGGGYLAMPIVDILFKVAKDNAIKTISQMVLQPYKSARCFLGAPLYTVS